MEEDLVVRKEVEEELVVEVSLTACCADYGQTTWYFVTLCYNDPMTNIKFYAMSTSDYMVTAL